MNALWSSGYKYLYYHEQWELEHNLIFKRKHLKLSISCTKKIGIHIKISSQWKKMGKNGVALHETEKRKPIAWIISNLQSYTSS